MASLHMSSKAHLTTLASKTTDLSGTQKNDVVYMQDMDQYGNVCRQTSQNATAEYHLVDRRYNPGGTVQYSYMINRLDDTKCWMAQNLAVQGGTNINSTYSNVDSGYAYTLPSSSNSLSNFANTDANNRTNAQMWNGTHIDNSYDIKGPNNGSYYNFQAVTANTGNRYTSLYETATNDICPSGWRLPIAYKNDGAKGDYWYILNTKIAMFNKAQIGRCNNDSCPDYSGDYTHRWSSTSHSQDRAYFLTSYSTSVTYRNIEDDHRRNGCTVRCVSK